MGFLWKTGRVESRALLSPLGTTEERPEERRQGLRESLLEEKKKRAGRGRGERKKERKNVVSESIRSLGVASGQVSNASTSFTSCRTGKSISLIVRENDGYVHHCLNELKLRVAIFFFLLLLLLLSLSLSLSLCLKPYVIAFVASQLEGSIAHFDEVFGSVLESYSGLPLFFFSLEQLEIEEIRIL